jgi:beta-aspartyl-peptidase (threonine type)
MKVIFRNIYLSIILIVFSCVSTLSQTGSAFTIVIHGGAGYISPEISPQRRDAYLNSLAEALFIGKEILSRGGTSLDAVENVIRYLENDSLFNAGKGAVFTNDGTHELDASIMNGSDLSTGAVAGVKTIKNPISLARLVMDETPHVLFAGDGADRLGERLGVELVDNKYFDTERRLKQLRKKHEEKIKGTVGCVAIDNYGNITAGTSTGGLTGKWSGRVGDSPLVNAGTYANNKTCGVSATGEGELFIRNTVAFNISALMEYKGLTLTEAAEEMILKRLSEESGGIIAVDNKGNYAMVFNTSSMLRGVANSEGLFEVDIWK